MSSIDNRIVQMQFENSQFEKGVKETLKTLEDLKDGLDFEKSEKSIASLQKAGDSFSLAKMANGVEAIGEKFSALGVIGKRVLEDLTDRAVNWGEKFVKSVTIDQVTAGFSKYAQKTSAVQQIVNATGQSIDEVNKQLEKLNWFTDETSYDFVDMVSNIGKFTSMNIPLDKSVTAMQGISTWAALSGAGIQQASHAMYNLSQAIGLGAVTMQDWKSISLANMATAEFKQTAIDTAVAMGKLKKGQVTLENFESTLSKKWFTSDVLISVLEKYGDFASQVYEVANEQGISAAQAMDIVSDGTKSLGERAFRAAQEAKTFGEAIASVKDAVSSGWMNTFENIFGNYEEAKVLWTDLANWLWDVFASGAEARNEVLAFWKELGEGEGGRTDLLQGIYDIFDGLYNIITAVKEAFSSIISPITVDNLKTVSLAIKDFGAGFKEMFGMAEITHTQIENMTDEEYELAKAAAKVQKEFGGDLKIKDRGEEVKELQKQLIALGYLKDSAADGIYGPKTEAAVKAFQKAQQLTQNGIFDEKTFRKLEEQSEAVSNVFKSPISKGARGDEVKAIQEKLIEYGYLDQRQADGIFGPKTEAAIKKFQKAQKLTTDGIVNEDTFKKLFPETVISRIKKTITTENWFSKSLKKLQRIVKGVAAGFDIFFRVLGFVGKIVGHVIGLLSPIGNAILEVAACVGDAIVAFDEWIKGSGDLDKAFENVKKFFEPIGDWATQAGKSILGFFGIGEEADKFSGSLSGIKAAFQSVIDFLFGEGDPTKGKSAGILRRFWQLVSGDLEGFTVGMSETDKQAVFDKIQGVKDFFDKIGDAISLLFTGKINSDSKLLEGEGAANIERFRISIYKFFESIGVLITGNWMPSEYSSLDSETVAKIQQFRETVFGVFDKVGEFVTSVIDTIESVFSGIDLSSFGSIEETFNTIWQNILTTLSTIGGSVGEGAKTAGQIGITVLMLPFIGAFNLITKAIDVVKGLITGSFAEGTTLSESFQEKIRNVRLFFVRISEALRLLFTGKKESYDKTTLSNDTKSKLIAFREGVSNALNWISTTFTTIKNSVTSFITGSAEGLSDKAYEAIRNTRLFFTRISEALRLLFTGEKESYDKTTLSNDTKSKLIAFREGVSNVLNWISTTYTNIKNAVTSFITGSAEGLSDKAYNAIQNVRLFFDRIGEALRLLFGGVVEEDANSKLSNDTKKNILAFRNGVIDILIIVHDTIVSVLGFIGKLFNGEYKIDSFKSVGDFFVKVWNGIKDFATKIGNSITKTISSTSDGVQNVFNSIIGFVRKWGLWILAAVALIKIGNTIQGVADIFKKDEESMSEAIRNIAISIALVAASFAVLALIKPEQFSQGLGGFIAIIAALVVLFGALTAIGSLSKIKKLDIAEPISKLAESIKGIGIGLLSLAGALVILGLFGDVIKKGLTNLGYLLVELGIFFFGLAEIVYGLSKVVGEKNPLEMLPDLVGSIKQLGQGIALITGALVVLGAGFLSGTIARGLENLAIILVELGAFFAALGYITKNVGDINVALKGFKDIAILIGVMAGAALLLGGLLRWDQALIGVGSVVIMLSAVAGLFWVMAKSFKDVGDSADEASESAEDNNGKIQIVLKGIWGLAVLVGVMAIAANSFTGLEWGDWGKAMLSIIVMLGMVALVFAALGKVDFKNVDIKTLLAMFGGLAVIIWELSAIINSIKDVDVWIIVAFTAGLSILIFAMSQAMPALAAVPVSALKGAAIMAGVLAILALAVNIIASLVAGGMNSMSSSIWNMGQSLARASTYFAAIDSSAGDNLNAFATSLSEGLGKLFSASFGDWNGISNELWTLAQRLYRAAGYFEKINPLAGMLFTGFTGSVKPGFDTLNTLDYTGVDNFVTAVERIGSAIDLYTSMTDGLSGGEGEGGYSLDTFITSFSESIGKLSGLTSQSEGIKQMLLDIGGAAGIFYGNLADIPSGETGEGPGEIDVTALQSAFNALGQLNLDESAMANVAKYAQDGDQVNEFAIGLQNLSAAIGNYSDEIGKLDSGAVSQANSVMTTIAGIQVALSNVGYISDFEGELKNNKTELEQFANDINLLGTALGNYGNDIGTLNKTNIANANDVLTTIAGIKLPKEGGFLDAFTGTQSKAFENFATNIGDIGAGIRDFALLLNGFEKNDDGSFSDTLSELGDGAAEIDSGKLTSALTIIEKFSKLELGKEGSFFTFITGNESTAMSYFAKNIGDLGSGVRDFVMALNGLERSDDGTVKQIEGIGEALSVFNSSTINPMLRVIQGIAEINLGREGSFLTFLTGNQSQAMGNFAENIGKLGKGLADLSTNVDGIDFTEGSKFQQAFDIIKTIGKIQQQITGEYSNTYALSEIGNSMQGFFNALGGISFEGVDFAGFEALGESYAKGLSAGFGETDPSVVYDLVSSMVETLNNYTSEFNTVGGYYAAGLAQGMRDNVSVVISAGEYIGQAGVDAAADVAGVASPALEMIKIGLYYALGLSEGMEEGASPVQAAASKLGEIVLEKLGDKKEDIVNALVNGEDIGSALSEAFNVNFENMDLSSLGGLFGFDFSNIEGLFSGDYSGILSLFGIDISNLKELSGLDFSDLQKLLSGDTSVLEGLDISKLGVVQNLLGGIEGKMQSFGLDSGFLGQLLSGDTSALESIDLSKLFSGDTEGASWWSSMLTNLGGGFASLADKVGITSGALDQFNGALKKGSKGNDVKEMQERLLELGYNLDKFGADGIFGPETQAALNDFKKDYGLAVDGVYDAAADAQLKNVTKGEKTGEGILSSLTKGMTSEDTADTGQIAASMISSLKGYTSQFNDVGANFTRGLANGTASLTYSAVNAAGRIAQAMITKIRGTFDVASPSKETAEIGEYFTLGLIEGVEEHSDKAIETTGNMAESMVDTAKEGLDKMSDTSAESSQTFEEKMASTMASTKTALGKLSRIMSESMVDTAKEGLDKMSDTSAESSQTFEEKMASTMASAKTALGKLSRILADGIDDAPVIRPMVDLSGAKLAAGSISSMFRDQSFGVTSNVMASNIASNRPKPRNLVNNDGGNGIGNQTTNNANSAVNLTGNNFYMRDERDINNLAFEIAGIAKQQFKGVGKRL